MIDTAGFGTGGVIVTCWEVAPGGSLRLGAMHISHDFQFIAGNYFDGYVSTEPASDIFQDPLVELAKRKRGRPKKLRVEVYEGAPAERCCF